MTRDAAMVCCENYNFNSHAHVERDITGKYSEGTENISTHTLTWSVTLIIIVHNHVNINFNSHAHVERDYSGFATPVQYQDFNSHAHVERDYHCLIELRQQCHFNSHAHVERDN